MPWFKWLHQLKMVCDIAWEPNNAQQSEHTVEQSVPHKFELQLKMIGSMSAWMASLPF
jgi:hypothetical protein